VNSRFHKGKERIGRFGHHEIATFAEYAVIPERAAIPIRKDAPLDAACLLACCALSGASAVLHRAKVVPGSRVVVIGCGGLGLSAINAAKLSGALQIIGVDVTPQKLQWAKEFGATDVIDASREDTVKRVAELTGGLLADYAFEFVGSEETIHQTVPSVRRGGMVVVEGAPPPGTVFRIAPRELLDSEKIITGAHGGGGVPPRDVPMLLDLYMAGKFMLRDLISHRMGLKDINKAFDLMISGESKRSVIIF